MKGQKASKVEMLQRGMGELAQMVQAQDQAIRFLLDRVKAIDEAVMPQEAEEPKKFEA